MAEYFPYRDRMALLLLRLFFPDDYKAIDFEQFDADTVGGPYPDLRKWIETRYDRTDQDLEDYFNEHEVLQYLRKTPATAADSAAARRDRAVRDMTDPLLDAVANEREVTELSYPATDEPVRAAVARQFLGRPATDDDRLIATWVETITNDTPDGDLPEEGGHVNIDRYEVDERALPVSYDHETFLAAISERFRDRNQRPEDETTQAHVAYVIGSLLSDSYFDPRGPGFDDAFGDAYNRGFDKPEMTPERAGATAREVYECVAKRVSRLKGKGPVTYQELAAVADAVVEIGPVDDNFVAKVRNAHDDYVSKTPSYDSLELPKIVTEDTAKAEIEPANIRAVAMVYAASELEGTGLITACDQAARDWSDGVLPVAESAGRLFDDYVWNRRDRLDDAARDIQYQRIDGLNDHLLRFCAATSERDRSEYLSEYLINRGDRIRSPQPGDATVRKAARDLLAYASLHGWAYTQFAAKRLGNHVRLCVDIIENTEVQKAYASQGPWQTVERVHAMSTGMTPDIAKHRTLAATGKDIIDLLAAKASAIAASRPGATLFPQHGDDEDAIFGVTEYEKLLNLVENWLAANAINDRQRIDASQVTDVGPSPSLPAMGGSGPDANAIKDQVMQMVSAGQMPTMDQVDQMFNFG